MIYFTSDLHFNHDKEFLYRPRGFDNIQDMNEAVIQNWNRIIGSDDTVYVLGDLILGDMDAGLDILKQLPGHLHIIIGNHDTNNRVKAYQTLDNVESVEYATIVKYGHYRFYLSHYPTMTSSLEKDNLRACLIDLYGHTHQKTNFYNEIPFMYHVGLDSHDCKPVSIEEALDDMRAKIQECRKLL